MLLRGWSCTILLFILGGITQLTVNGRGITFPVYINNPADVDHASPEFSLLLTDSASQTVRSFCAGYGIDIIPCMALRDFTIKSLVSFGIDVDKPIERKEHDVVVVTDGTLTLSSVLMWPGIIFGIDLFELNRQPTSDYLMVGGFNKDNEITAAVDYFCAKHLINGQSCRGLHFEVRSYLHCLLHNQQGATVRCLLNRMYFDDDISNLYFLYDVQEQPYEQPSRYFYNSITTYHNYRTSQVCAKHKFTREQCFNFFKYVHAKLSEFTPNKSDEILPTLYVYHVLAHLVKMHSEREAVFGINETDIRLVDGERITATGETRLDLDFLEIGTSNFNTISQMLDPPPPIPVSDAAGARVGAQAQGAAAVAGDPLTLRGMAVEPSAEYLAQLPDRPGVLKVNAAIVPESSTDTKSSTADDAVEGPLGSSQRRGGGQEGRYLDFYHIPESVIDREGLAQFLKGCNSIGDYHLLHKKGGFTHLVQIRKVPALTIRELLTTHRVRRVRLLKIDAEGYDITILQELYHYLVASRDELLYPERILFESNDPYRVAEVVQLVQQYVSLGYNVAYSGDDTILERLR